MKNSKKMLTKAYRVAAKCSDKVLELAHNWAFEPVFYCVEQYEEEVHYFYVRIDFNTNEVWFREDQEGYLWTMWFQF